MKVKFCCDNHANIHSKYTDIFDVEKDLGISLEEWKEMTEDEKNNLVMEWALERYDYWYEEV